MSSKYFWHKCSSDVYVLCETKTNCDSHVVLTVSCKDGSYYVSGTVPLLSVTSMEDALKAASDYYMCQLEDDIMELTHQLNTAINCRKAFENLILNRS